VYSSEMNSKYVAVVAALAVMLVAATALTTTDNAFATKSKSQSAAQANDCGNGKLPENVGCQNTASQIQGDDNTAALASSQQFED
jgi:NADH:ubiquinone oxidoreductase subunit 3 (subunit A)